MVSSKLLPALRICKNDALDVTWSHDYALEKDINGVGYFIVNGQKKTPLLNTNITKDLKTILNAIRTNKPMTINEWLEDNGTSVTDKQSVELNKLFQPIDKE